MANNYNDVFGNHTLPPSEYGYRLLTIVADTTLVWPYNSDGGIATVAKVMDVTCAAGNVLTLPDATQVSVGEDLLIRNIGANALTIKDASGVQIATVAIGAASYFYLTDNSTVAGVFGVIGFGIGTSTADAASLVGYGIKAIDVSLNQSHPVVPFASGVTLDETYRAKLVVSTGGTGTFSLTSAATLGNDYFVMFRNEGTGTVTIDPASSETVDGQGTLQVQPGESLMLICTGTQWYSVGYGRSTLYQFTQLTKDVSAGGTITLTAAEASNKLLTFIGNPTGTVTVVVPAIVAVYYTYSNISTIQSIVVKTAAGFGAVIGQGARIIMICDGTNVLSAQSAVANAAVSLTDGSAATPSLFFSSQTNTGLFKHGTANLGFTVAGVQQGYFGAAGLVIATVGANDTQRHTLPAVASDTVALLAAAQTFTNKTISGAANTLTNIPNASLVNSAITINGSVVALGGNLTIAASATPFTPAGNIAATNVQAAIQELDSEKVSKSGDTMTGPLAVDMASTTHIAMKVSGTTEGYFYADVGGVGVLNSLANRVFHNPAGTVDLVVDGNLTAANLSGTNTGDQTAALVPFTPAGNIAATNVQAAIQELDSETQAGLATKVSKSGDTMTGELTVATRLNVKPGSGGNKVCLIGSTGSPNNANIGFFSDYSGYSIDFVCGPSLNDKFVGRMYDDGRMMLGTQTGFSGLPYGLISYGNRPGSGFQNLIAVQEGGGALAIGYYFQGGVGEYGIINSVNTNNLSADRPMRIGCSTFTQNGNLVTTTAGNTSDRRTKENIEDLEGALARVLQLRPVTFTFKQEFRFNRLGTQFGVIADEIEQVVPEVVHTDAAWAGDLGKDDPDPIKSVDYVSLVPILTAAIQELSAKLDATVAEIAALKADK